MKNEDDLPTNFEQEIDAALRMLGQSQPPVGLTARVHRSLATAAAAKQARRGWLVWVPVASASAAAVLFAVTLEVHSVSKKQTGMVESAKIAAKDSIQPVQTSRFGPTSPQVASNRMASTKAAAHRNRRPKVGRQRDAANLMSYPLTRQEKLLVEFAQHAKPEDLRDLNPEYQAKVEAQQEAEFAAYLKSGSSSTTQKAETVDTNSTTQE